MNYHRAIEGELERSIMSINEVESARVHITFPKQSIFLENHQPAKASVLLKLKPGSRVVAHDFDIDDWKPTRVEYLGPPSDGTADYADSRTLYIWQVGDAPAMP